MNLNDLRKQAQTLALKVSEIRAAAITGEALLERKLLFPRFGELLSAERYHQIRELAGKSTGNRALRLSRLADFLALAHSDQLAASLLDSLDAEAREKPLNHPESAEPLSMEQALLSLQHLASAEARQILQQRIRRRLQKQEKLVVERLEADTRAATQLELPSAASLAQLRGSFGDPELSRHCEAFLNQSEAMYRDLLSWRLRKISESGSLPSERSRADIVRASHPFEFDKLFRVPFRRFEEGLLRMGLHPRAEGRIFVDSEQRPGRQQEAQAIPLNPPFEILISHQPHGGFHDSFSRMHSLGVALFQANMDPQRPFEDRMLGDEALDFAFGSLFSNIFFDSGWLSRELESDSPDLPRAIAFRGLLQARIYAAQIVAKENAQEWGPGSKALALYSSTLSEHLQGHWPEEHFWLDSFTPSASHLRGRVLESLLHHELRQRFDEDWWRNPATGSWLLKLFSAGRFLDSDSLMQQLLDGGKKGQFNGEEPSSSKEELSAKSSGGLILVSGNGLSDHLAAQLAEFPDALTMLADLPSETAKKNPLPESEEEGSHLSTVDLTAAFGRLVSRFEEILN